MVIAIITAKNCNKLKKIKIVSSLKHPEKISVTNLPTIKTIQINQLTVPRIKLCLNPE